MFQEKNAQGVRRLEKYIKSLTSVLSFSIILDRDGNILYFSNNFKKLMEAEDLDSYLGMPMSNICKLLGDECFLQRASHRLSRAMSGEEEEFFEDDMVSWPSGEKRLYRLIYKWMKDEDGELDHILLAAFDITGLRLEETKRHLNELLATTVLPCFIWDRNGVILEYNKEAARVFGTPEDITPEECYKEFFASIQPKFQPDGGISEEIRQKLVAEALEKGFAQTNVQLAKRDGTPLYFMVNIARISWAFDYRLVVYFYETTDAVLKEIEAKQAEERAKLMLDANPLMCVLRDDQGKIIDCNQEALNILGIPDKEEFCRNYYSFFPVFQPGGVSSVERTVEIMEFVSENPSITVERTFQSSTGELIPVESKIVRMPWKDSYCYLSFSRDLREEKANEQKMKEITERERKAELQREAAQAANEAKNQFLANMSHEIRTPMNAILGMAELLLQESFSKRQQRYVKGIKASAVALLNIINDILDVSKLQVGKLKLMPVHYDFSLLIANIYSTAQFLIKNKAINFELVLDEQSPVYLYGDDMRLRQVLLNLLSNAIKFTDEGYVRLSISFTETTIKIIVSDTGIGIPAESIPTLFDAFIQVDTEKNRSTKGTGLGLTISKLIIEAMGGEITVESECGRGSSFHIEIPKILGDVTQIRHVDDEVSVVSTPDAKVLLVDDNTVNLTVAFELLRLYDIKPDTATCGKQSIELIKKNEYDLVFMDHMMPGMNGVEATKIIRKMGINVPIVALTANAVSGMKEMMLEAGMNDYLSKPIIRTELTNILRKWIPAEKLLNPLSGVTASSKVKDEGYREFWRSIEQIEEFSISEGLERVGGQWDVYEKLLKLLIYEIEKTYKNLSEFLLTNDMENFRIEVHGIKGALASIGAVELSEKAYALEVASGKKDTVFCAENLPPLLERLSDLSLSLKEAFSTASDDGVFVIPSEMPQIFARLISAFAKTDLMLIDKEVESLDALKLSGALEEEVEQIKDMVMMMNYDDATKKMHNLLNNTQHFDFTA